MTPEIFFEEVYENFNIDDESWGKKGEAILYQYELASDPEKAILNYLMVTMTGWTIPSLIEKAGGEKPISDPLACTISIYKTD